MGEIEKFTSFSETSPQQATSPSQRETGPSKSESLAAKIGLALLTFLLGLVASYITTFFFAPQRQGAYSTSYSKLITAASEVPAALQISKDLITTANTITRIDHTVENTGHLEIADLNVLNVLSSGTEVLVKQITTFPSREVPFTDEPPKNPGEIRISGITLEPQQRIALTLYVKSATSPTMTTYFSGGGGPIDWTRSSLGANNLSLQESAIQTARNLVLALVVPGLIGAIPTVSGMIMYGVPGRKWRDRERAQRYGVALAGTSSMFASLVRLLLFLRALQSALPIIRHLAE